MQPGVEVEISKNQKDELILFGNSLENVSQSAADIQQICRVRNKDIRKVRLSCLKGGRAIGLLIRITYSSWMVSTSRRRVTLWRSDGHRALGFFVLYGSYRSGKGSSAFACFVAGKSLQQNGQPCKEPHRWCSTKLHHCGPMFRDRDVHRSRGEVESTRVPHFCQIPGQ